MSVGAIHNLLTETRANFDALDSLRQMGVVQQKLGPINTAVDGVFSAAKLPVTGTRLLAFTGWIAGAQKLKKEYKEPSKDYVSRTLNIVAGMRTFCTSTTSFVKGVDAFKLMQYTSNEVFHSVFKTCSAACVPIATVGSLLAAGVFLSKAYEHKLVNQFIAAWKQNSGNPEKLIDLIAKMDPTEFRKIFRSEKESFKALTSEETAPEVRAKMLEMLGERMSATPLVIKSCMGSALLFGTSNWLAVFKVAPAASVILRNISAGWQAVNSIQQAWSAYSFKRAARNIKARVLNPLQHGSPILLKIGKLAEKISFVRKGYKSLKAHGWKKIDHGARAFSDLGGLFIQVGFGLQTVKNFLPAVVTTAALFQKATPYLVGVGVFFSGACLFNDIRNIYKIRQFQKEYRAIHQKWQDGVEHKSFREKDAAFKAMTQLVKNSRKGIIQKSFGVKKEDLHQILNKVYVYSHNDKEMAQVMQSLDKRITTQIHSELVKIAMDVASIACSICFIVPVLTPLGYVLWMGTLAGTGYTFYRENRSTYQFEKEIGMINSRFAQNRKTRTFKQWVFDRYGITALMEKMEKKTQPTGRYPRPVLRATPVRVRAN